MGDFQAETDSIRAAASWMETNAIATATKLQETMNSLKGFAAQSDWSQVPSCIAFGSTYTSAVDAYKAVADDLVKDAQAMRDTLNKIADDYVNADESSRAAFNARLAALGSQGYMDQSPADDTYRDHRPDLHSDNPEAAPHQDADTGSSSTTAPSTPAASGTTGAGRVRME